MVEERFSASHTHTFTHAVATQPAGCVSATEWGSARFIYLRLSPPPSPPPPHRQSARSRLGPPETWRGSAATRACPTADGVTTGEGGGDARVVVTLCLYFMLLCVCLCRLVGVDVKVEAAAA